jgi:hypothetical protein
MLPLLPKIHAECYGWYQRYTVRAAIGAKDTLRSLPRIAKIHATVTFHIKDTSWRLPFINWEQRYTLKATIDTECTLNTTVETEYVRLNNFCLWNISIFVLLITINYNKISIQMSVFDSGRNIWWPQFQKRYFSDIHLTSKNEIYRDVKPCRLVNSYISFSLLRLLHSKVEGTAVFRKVGNYLPPDTGSNVAYKMSYFEVSWFLINYGKYLPP